MKENNSKSTSPKGDKAEHDLASDIESDAEKSHNKPQQTPRQLRAINRIASTESDQTRYSVLVIPSYKSPAHANFGAVKKIKSVNSRLSDDLISEVSQTEESSATPSKKVRKAAQLAAQKTQTTTCCSLSDVTNLCSRLSGQNRAAIEEYITSILNKNQLMAEQLKKYEIDLKKQEEVNERISRRLDALESSSSNHTTKPTTSGPTLAQLVARAPKTKLPKSVQELTKLIPSIKNKTANNVVRIIPPSGTKNPEKDITRIYNPAEFNIKVRSLRSTTSKELIVRTEGPEDVTKLTQADDLVKHGYKVVPITAKNPKIIIFGLNIKESKDLVEQVYDQNADFAGDDYKIFAQQFKPIYSWSSNKRPQNWVVEVHPELTKLIFDKGARVYIQWQSHRVEDYVDATRYFKCQKYGHVAKHCHQNQDTCGHCAQTDTDLNPVQI